MVQLKIRQEQVTARLYESNHGFKSTMGTVYHNKVHVPLNGQNLDWYTWSMYIK